MKSLRTLPIPFLMVVAILLSACGGAPAAAPTSQLDIILTEGVKTMVASYFETQTALAPVATATQPSPTITPSPAYTPTGFLNPLPTLTSTFLWYPTIAVSPTVTGTPPTATLPAGGSGCNNLYLIAELYPGGSNEMQPGEAFIMTWKVHNSGTCEWKAYYRITFVSGQDFDPYIVNLGRTYEIGKNPELSVQMDAPRRTGTFTAHFRMSDGNGNLFGSTLPVTIKVVGDQPDTPVPPTATNTSTPTFTPSPTITNTPTTPGP